MPLALQYSADGRGAFATASGKLTGDEFLAAVKTVNERDPTTPILYLFFDFNGVSEVTWSVEDIKEAAKLAVAASRQDGVPRVVAIFAADDLHYGLARMYLAYIEETGWEASIFRTRPDAIAWLRQRVATKFGIAVDLA